MVTGHRELVKQWIFGQDLYQDLTNVLVDTQIHALKRKSGVIAIQVNEKKRTNLGHYIPIQKCFYIVFPRIVSALE